MRRQVIRLSMLVVLFAMLRPGFLLAQKPATKAAQTSVEAWLSLTDGQSYAESWDAAGSLFKSAITREKWTAALEQVRRPLGQVKSRTLKSATPTPTPPGAPEGEYVTLQFSTDFEQRSAAAETVAAFKEKDGTWRVAGYFIK